MSYSHKITNLVGTALCAVLGLCVAASPLQAKKNNGVGQGSEPVYYFASSSYLGFSEVDSNGTDSKQLVFRDTPIQIDVLTDCPYDTLDGANDGVITGVLVLQPKSNKNPYVATLTFWFEAPLGGPTGDPVTHRLYMEGRFDPDNEDNWPPNPGVPHTLEFDEYWEVAAENPRAQKSDCDDGDGPGIDPIYVTVEHETPPDP